jgi:predicted small metal-binding protein
MNDFLHWTCHKCGFVVYANTLALYHASILEHIKKEHSINSYSSLHLTNSDKEFLQGCGIAI